MDARNWIVVNGTLVDTTRGGGFEFFGPFTEEEAERVRRAMLRHHQDQVVTGQVVIAVQLLRHPAAPQERADTEERAGERRECCVR